ncbi:MAG: TrmB family transcriptional regulator [Candidatus Bathyarchaeia archaeon]|nr:TrmB family transcriptional regulator [Candidatus Bathyarchaeota archaeon]
MSEEVKVALKEMGLTEYEMRAYLYLLKAGLSTASQLSDEANIPYSKVYEVLNSLERKGWIRSQEGRPRLYYPKSPKEAIEENRLRMEDKMRTWHKLILMELQPIYEKREIREKPDIWIFRGEPDAIAKLKEMLNNAKVEVLIAAPKIALPIVSASLPFLKAFSGSDVKLLIMLSGDLDESSRGLIGLGEVKFKSGMFGGGIIVDEHEALLILGESGPSLIIWSNHLDLVRFAKSYFYYLWETAHKAD